MMANTYKHAKSKAAIQVPQRERNQTSDL